MKIGINALFLRPGKNGGIETYFRELLAALAEEAPQHSYIVYLCSEAANYPLPVGNVKRVVFPFSGGRPALRYLWEQLVLPVQVRADQLDLLHSLAYVAPLAIDCPSLLTVHDLNFRAPGHRMSPLRRWILGSFCHLSCRRAAHIIAVSDFTKEALIKELGIERSRVTRIHEAGARLPAGGVPPPLPPSGYIASFGGRFPNKNVARLLAAYGRIAGHCPQDLVIIGEMDASFRPALDELPPDLKRRVHWLGYLPDAQVAMVLKGAALYVHPSLYEGFGMPLLEAQALGVVVVSSNAASLPEVGGAGAIYFDPMSVEDMASKMLAGLLDREIRRDTVGKAEENLTKYSWRRTARETLRLYGEFARE
jgi:glycosyltransferase involved in cell wall biosynthesis